MIIHKQDVTNLEDILKFLQDYILSEDLAEKYTELELEWLKLSRKLGQSSAISATIFQGSPIKLSMSTS